ncbi:MAG: 2-hydroxyacid dehydrogenase [Ideonella sp.]|nr:2-hydroxyacid dehydrogenase [Ideonella sp.]MBL0150043.1 2-hydroxyacid dehydrogenase [Ideonella sp.]
MSAPVANPRPEILAVARLPPMLATQLSAAFTVHERLHELDPAALAAAAPRIRAVVGGGESKVSAELIGQLPALEMISVMGVGYDGIDVAAAKARSVMVTHTPNVLNDDVADLAIGLMLCAARQLPAADRWVREGRWPTGPMPLARKMSGARLGIVGMGRIGQAIAQRALAFGMSIAYTARSAKGQLPHRFVASVEALAAESDFLVVITPGGAGTRKMIDARVLAALGASSPQKGILVNVARGSVVDEAALIDALERGVIAGAGLDVFEAEPNVPERLRALPQVVLTPHIGSATSQTRQAMADLAFNNLAAHFAGQRVHTPVPECAAG